MKWQIMADFQEKVRRMRRKWQEGIATGNVRPEFDQQLAELEKEEADILQQLLPSVRKRLLDSRDPHPEKQILCSSEKALVETDLSLMERKLCHQLYSSAPAEEVQVPEANGFSEDAYPCMFYCIVRNEHTAFLFGDDGTVLLLEKDLGSWMCRKKPLFTDVLIQNAVMETDASCLVLSMDGQAVRLCYDRLCTGEDLRKVSFV